MHSVWNGDNSKIIKDAMIFRYSEGTSLLVLTKQKQPKIVFGNWDKAEIDITWKLSNIN